MSKSYRQGQILKLIHSRRVYTQQELADALGASGISATQVTLSRAIRELGLVETSQGYADSVQAAPSGPDLTTVILRKVFAGRAGGAESAGAEDAARKRESAGRSTGSGRLAGNHGHDRRREHRAGGRTGRWDRAGIAAKAASVFWARGTLQAATTIAKRIENPPNGGLFQKSEERRPEPRSIRVGLTQRTIADNKLKIQ